jgi:hypothetical protein
MAAIMNMTDRNFRGAYCLHHQGDEYALHGVVFQKASSSALTIRQCSGDQLYYLVPYF